jgi:hypothetical protein
MKPICQFFLLVAGAMLAVMPVHAQRDVRPAYQSLTPGLDYAHIQMTNWNKAEPWSIHIARLDRSQKDLGLASVLSDNRVFGTAPISTIAKSFPEAMGQPLVLINTGFCINKKHPYLGAPRGLVIMEGQLITGPSKYSFWVNENGTMAFGEVEPKFNVALPGGKTFPIILNHECTANEVVLFTDKLGKSTRATNHLELVLEDPKHQSLSWRIGQSYSMRIKAVNPQGNSALSNTVAVLSFGSEPAASAGKLRVGDTIKLELTTKPDLSKAVTGSEGIFPIVSKGEVLKEFDGGKYILGKHPRTAIGFNERFFFMVVVDGRQKTLSMGMNPTELAQFMAALGCTEAMNLDGGGSSTFWADGKRRNSVAGSRERDRSDALVIVQKAGKKRIAAASQKAGQ